MEVATTKEARALTNRVKAITPGTLKEVLSSYATKEYVDDHGGGSGGSVNDVKVNGSSVVTDKVANVTVPTSLSQLTNDASYVQTQNGTIPGNLIPSSFDDVREYTDYAHLPSEGETGVIYVLLSDSDNPNSIWRWSTASSTYVKLVKQLELGTTDTTAYRGDRGNAAYNHTLKINNSQAVSDQNPHGLTLSVFNIAVTAAEINYLSGLGENITTALGKKLNLAGGVMTGMLTLSANPSENLHAATKYYVDAKYQDVAVLITLNVQNIKSLSRYFDTYKEESKTNIDTVTILSNSLNGYDSYIQCPNYKYLNNVDYFLKTVETVYERTDDILFKPLTIYYTRSGSGTVLDPYVYTVYTGDPAYEDYDIIPLSLELYIKQEGKEIYHQLTAGSDYNVGDITYDLTTDTTYQEDTIYYVVDNEGLFWDTLLIIDYYEQDGKFLDNQQYYEYLNEQYVLITYDSTNHTYTLNNGTVYHVDDEIPDRIFLYTGDYNVGDSIPANTVYEFNNIYTIQREEGLDQAVQRNEQFISTQTATNKSLVEQFTTVDILAKSLNTTVNGGNIFVISDDYTFENNKTYYYKTPSDTYEVYTSYTVGDLIVIGSEYICSGEETGTYHFTFNDTTYSFTMPSGIEEGDKLYYDADQEKLFLGETEITITESDSGIELAFVNIKPIELYETQMQEALTKLVDDNYKDVLERLASYDTTEDVNAKIQTLKETTTSTYKKTEIQSILKGLGYVLTDDKTYQSNKTYYDVNHNKLSNYNIGDPIPVGTSGLNETIYEKLITEFFESKAGVFDDNGLTIQKEDEEGQLIGYSASNLDTDGLDVRAIVNGQKASEPTLFAGVEESGQSIVRSININVKEYLYAANQHLRIEKFIGDHSINTRDVEGWGGFYL